MTYIPNDSQIEFNNRFGQKQQTDRVVLIRKLFSAFKKRASDQDIHAWEDELRSYKIEIVDSAYKSIINKGDKFMPSLGEFLKECKALSKPIYKSKDVSNKDLYCMSKENYLKKLGPTDAAKMALKLSLLSDEDKQPRKI